MPKSEGGASSELHAAITEALRQQDVEAAWEEAVTSILRRDGPHMRRAIREAVRAEWDAMYDAKLAEHRRANAEIAAARIRHESEAPNV